MSNDSPPPNPDPDKSGRTPPIRPTEATETDLWDLETEEKEFALPPERKINPSAVEVFAPRDKPAEKTAPDPREIAETQDDEPPAGNNEESEAKALIASISSLSKVEKIAIACLFAALALGATLALIHFSNQVPTRPFVTEKIDYPVTGEIIVITDASTYWRAPVTTGSNADVVRRGTKLIPVLKMKLNPSSTTGAIRIFFRNDEGLVIGDGITRTVKDAGEITVAATAGFDDVGMHTAYRTRADDSKPWVVQVFEGPDATAPSEKFHKVLETEITTMIR